MRFLERVEHMAQAAPHACAVRTSDGAEMSYGALWTASEALAASICLRNAQAEGPYRAPVIVYGHKDPLMVACFLAYMKAGVPYVPLDCHSVPEGRVRTIAAQIADESARRGAPSRVLTLACEDVPCIADILAIEVVDRASLEAAVAEGGASDPARWVSGEDLAYILFTSGSTGAPKGVQVTAACLDNFCAWDLELAYGASAREGVDAGDVAGACGAEAVREPRGAAIAHEATGSGSIWLDQAPFSFDLSVFELVGALASGGTLFSLTHNAQQSMAAQMDALRASGVNIWVSTPSFAQMCLANQGFSGDALPDLRLFLFCGETLPNATAARLFERFPAARILNTYGPTESTVAVTAVEITPALAAAPGPLPVGLPRPGTRIRILGEDGAEVPAGTYGEVVIEGDTVAAGYFGRLDLTEQAFAKTVLAGDSVRTYRTGDEGCLDASGMLHFRGRIDLQVKLNGFRIELGEIEEGLRRQPGVSAAAVVPACREGRLTHLVAYVVAPVPEGTSAFRAGLALKQRLGETLPHYMIPKRIIFCERLPLTGNGKVDRRALAAQNTR